MPDRSTLFSPLKSQFILEVLSTHLSLFLLPSEYLKVKESTRLFLKDTGIIVMVNKPN